MSQALARDVETAPEPFVQEWPGRRALALEIAGALATPLAILTALTLFAGVRYAPESVAFIVALMLLLAAFPVSARLLGTRRLLIDGEQIAIVSARRLKVLRWVQVNTIRARRDLERVRLEQQGRHVDLDLSRLGENERLAVLGALRARAPALPVQPWLDRGRKLRAAVIPLLGTLLVLGGFRLGKDYVGYSMGMRCSGPSSYMHERFDLPDGPGCIIIGVSGAAERAGLLQGDKIIEQDGQPITSGPQFNDRFFDEDDSWLVVPPRKMRFVVLRGGEREPLRITLSLGPGGGIDLPEDDPLYWFRRARARLGEDPETGIEEYSRAIELAPEFDLAYLYRGDLHYDLDDVDSAWADYQRALELNPSLAEAHRSMAWLWSAGVGDDLVRAEEYVKRAVELDTCDSGFIRYNLDCRYDYLFLAEIYEQQGSAVAAQDAREQAEVFYPK